MDDLGSAPTQRKALEVILATADPGEPIPTLQELAAILKLKAPSNVRRVLEGLEAKHYIVWDRGPSGRAKTGRIRPTKKAYEWRSASQGLSMALVSPSRFVEPGTRLVPLRGEVAAGIPIPAEEENVRPIPDDEENVREYLPLPARHLHEAEDEAFIIQVKGESMTGDGVLPGDYVVVVPTSEWKNGEMIVVIVDGEATVKRVWRDGKAIRLMSSNPAFPPRTLKQEDAPSVQGKVIGVIRWDIK